MSFLSTPTFRYTAFLLLTGIVAILLVALPVEASLPLFVLIAAGSLGIGVARMSTVQARTREAVRGMTARAPKLDLRAGSISVPALRLRPFSTAKTWQLDRVTIRQAAVEWGLIALTAWAATRSLHNFSDQVQLSGNDMVHLTRSADFAGQFLRSSGKIPLWDPFIGNGQPMLEAVQSFILNPLMSLPIMLLGAKPGVLVVVLLHALIFGWGGWVWARVMGFGMGGRLLMGALLVSSGSVTGALNHGVFQLALSQAYMPYVYAGLTAMLFVPHQRWGLVLFVVATTLLIFSGTFWYILPTAFGCALIALFALIDVRNRKIFLDHAVLRKLLLAGILVVGLAAIRLLPINRELLHHPTQSYDYVLSYAQVFINYFDPNYTSETGQWFVLYHYVVPAWLMAAVAPLALATLPWFQHRLVGGWRIVLAGILFVLIISFFGMGPTPAVNAVYSALPFLQDWRNPGRMAAAASPWIVLAAGWAFDRLTRAAWGLIQRNGPGRLIGAASLVALVAGGLAGAMQVANNWTSSISIIPASTMFPLVQVGAETLRERYPSQFLAVHSGWITHFLLNEHLIRHPYGDNEVFTIGVAPTIGHEQFEYVEEFAFGDTPDSGNGIWLLENGYVEMENVPVGENIGAVLDYNPEALPYAYAVSELTLMGQGSTRLRRSMVQPVTYYHRIDQVEVELTDPAPATVVVIQETHYPGWTVTINGETQPLESVHRHLAVRVPAEVEQARIVFSYAPPRLYLGGAITLITAALIASYALRLDRRFAPALKLAGISPPPVQERAAENSVRAPVIAAPAKQGKQGRSAAQIAVQKPDSEDTSGTAATKAEAKAAVLRMRLGFRRQRIEVPPSTVHQTIEVVPSWSVSIIVVMLAAASAAFGALFVLMLRSPSKKDSA